MPFLTEALDSIINQTYKNLEIICIDDGSTDQTSQILEKYVFNDKRISLVVNKKNLGLIESLNKGIDLASGEFIARMDADDISHPKRIQKQYKFIVKNNLDVISCAFLYFKKKDVIITKREVKASKSIALKFVSLFSPPIMHGGIFAKASVLKKDKFLLSDQVLHIEDYELFIRLLKKGYKLGNLNEYLYFVRKDNEFSVSVKHKDLQDNNFIGLNEEYISQELNINVPPIPHLISINRFPEKLGFRDCIKSFSFLKKVKKEFLLKYKMKVTPDDEKEINIFWGHHVLDILIQLIKRVKFPLLLASMVGYFIFFKYITNGKVFRYFLSKTNKLLYK